MNRKTMVIGASPNHDRYSNRAVRSLVAHSVPVVAVGLRSGEIGDVIIQKPYPVCDGIHTVTMYVGPANQKSYYDYILNLNPKRVIFNPGTENIVFEKMLKCKGIEVVYDCTLVMLVNEEY